MSQAHTTILGAGLAGLSCSYHLGHDDCLIFERNSYAGGHIYSHHRDGFVWDEGPHVSFTKHPYVRELFEQSVHGKYLEYEVDVRNYFKGHWIPHPAQSNLWAVPEPIRSDCLDDFLKSRSNIDSVNSPSNYAEWLEQAFGKVFSERFPCVYTKKYWTCEPELMTTDWVGQRVYRPDVEAVERGYYAKPSQSTHYVKAVRYPTKDGYMQFSDKLHEGSNIYFNHCVDSIDLNEHLIVFGNGKQHRYERLISTIPLPEFVRSIVNPPADVLDAANSLNCTSLLLVNVTAKHVSMRPYNWVYVYDDDKLSTRINTVELMSPNNAPNGKTGVQVEVYYSSYRSLSLTESEVARIVVDELKDMGLIMEAESVHTVSVPYANVICDHQRRKSLDTIFSYLERFGLEREDDDLEPMTEWLDDDFRMVGNLSFAGRFGQWKYYWSDDCVLRGKMIKAD